MKARRDFEVDGQVFAFENLADGTEVISAGGQPLSSVKAHFGGKHDFLHNGRSYEIKVKPGLMGIGFDVSVNGVKQKIKAEKLPVWVTIACGWPLILVLIGGAIGGGLGGAAAALNFSVYKSKMPAVAKVLLNIFIGLAAAILWLLAARAIQSAMQPK